MKNKCPKKKLNLFNFKNALLHDHTHEFDLNQNKYRHKINISVNCIAKKVKSINPIRIYDVNDLYDIFAGWLIIRLKLKRKLNLASSCHCIVRYYEIVWP